MVKLFFSLPYQRVQKLELPAIVTETLAIVEKYGAEAMFVDGMYRMLKAEMPNVIKLSEISGSHPLTTELVQLRKHRDRVVQSVQKFSESISSIPGFSEQAAAIIPVVKRCMRGYSQENLKVKTERVEQFKAAIENDPTLKSAIETAGAKAIVDELLSTQHTINLNTSLRREALSVKILEDRKALRKRIVVALRNLYTAIELASVEHPDVDYKPMVNELNRLLVTYQAIIRSRLTRSRTMAQKTAVADSDQTKATAV
jgi:hypothetical protein